MFNVTDRATLNGILERTDAYATGSGFLDSQSVNGITVIPLEDNLDNKMVYVKREEMGLRDLHQVKIKKLELKQFQLTLIQSLDFLLLSCTNELISSDSALGFQSQHRRVRNVFHNHLTMRRHPLMTR